MKKKALVVGATGLVGSEVVDVLLESGDYEKVIIWVRNPSCMSRAGLEEKIIDFEQIEDYKIDEKIDHVYCCLGTTIKKAKTKDAFKKVDLEYPLALGRWAVKNGVSQYLLVSSVGADETSKVFYSKTKGQLENGLKELGLNGIKIFRPSLLLGKRKEFRFGESFATVISKFLPFLFWGPMKPYKPVKARDVAMAMYKEAMKEKTGTVIISSNEIIG